MVFCGQCGYQLAPGDKVCPRCGAATEAATIEQDPGTYNPTEISHAVLDYSSPQNRGAAPRQPEQGPLVLGASSPNEQMANEATAMMQSQGYAQQQQPSYPGYPQQQMGTGMYTYPPQQMGTGMYNYPAAGYQQYQGGPSPAMAQLLESSRRGKTTSLLLILFGLLLLIGAMIIFLLNQRGMIFA